MSALVEIREQGRGVAGALLVLGISFAYTIETWWLAISVPAIHLVTYVIVGLALVLVVTRSIGFRDESAEGADNVEHVPLWIEFAEVVFQSLVAGYGMLFLFGILTTEMSLGLIVRLGLVELVPLE